MHCGIPGLHPLDASGIPASQAVTTTNVSRHGLTSPGGHSHPQLRITEVKLTVQKGKTDVKKLNLVSIEIVASAKKVVNRMLCWRVIRKGICFAKLRWSEAGLTLSFDLHKG